MGLATSSGISTFVIGHLSLQRHPLSLLVPFSLGIDAWDLVYYQAGFKLSPRKDVVHLQVKAVDAFTRKGHDGFQRTRRIILYPVQPVSYQPVNRDNCVGFAYLHRNTADE
jgi:hypothetical protein